MMKTPKSALLIGLVWPEPTSSAAGVRMLQIVHTLLAGGYEVVFASAASRSAYSADLEVLGVREQPIQLNDNSFNHFVRTLMPDIVLYDRFITEEQYGWRVTEECPEALTVLDTEDLHFLRAARQEASRKQQAVHLFSDTAKRELAAIFRCDLSLIISTTEMDLLTRVFKVDPAILYYLPFLEEKIIPDQVENWIGYEDRQHFVFIGNFLHEPNVDAVQALKKEIWPLIRLQLPKVELHIYGAYMGQKIQQLHQPREGFHIQGRAPDARKMLENYRLLLAPIRFGAGLKGKFIDAMQSGTPTVTTTTGAEGMHGNLDWAGKIVPFEPELFAQSAIELYQDSLGWKEAQKNGIRLVNERYQRKQFEQLFLDKLVILFSDLSIHRQQNFIGQILQLQLLQRTKYMSLWIEEKNKKA